MWIVSFIFDDEAEKSHKVCKALQYGVEYSIGRSAKCTFRIQTDKSISRVHLLIKFDGSDLIITNKGKLTKFNEEIIPLDETIVVHNQNTVINIGGMPIDVNVRYFYEEWKIPHRLELNETKSLVSDFGVKLSESFSKKTTTQICSDSSSYSGCLFALLKGVPVVSIEFLNQMGKLLQQGNYLDFQSMYQGLLNRHKLFPSYRYVPNVLSNMTLIVFEQKMYDTLRYTIEVGGGDAKLLANSSELDKFLSTNHEPAVVLGSSISQKMNSESTKLLEEFDKSIAETSLRHGVKLLNINQFVNILLENKINGLKKRDVVDLTSPSPVQQKKIQSAKASVNGKKTKSKPNIQSLDSLNFFGGGNLEVTQNEEKHEPVISHTSESKVKVKEESKAFVPYNDNQDLDTSANGNTKTLPSYITNKSSLGGMSTEPANQPHTSTKKDDRTELQKVRRKRPRVQQLDNLMMRSSSQQATQIEPDDRNDKLKLRRIGDTASNVNAEGVLPSNSPSNAENMIKNIKTPDISNKNPTLSAISLLEPGGAEHVSAKKNLISDGGKSIDAQSSNRIEQNMGNMTELDSRPHSVARLETDLQVRSSTNIITAIAETKQKEVKRLQEGIIEVDQSELTESALIDFKDAAKINTIQIKPRVLASIPISNGNTKWLGRKNFKKFKKNWPSYLRRTTEGLCSDNTSNQIGREYITMRKYDSRKAKKHIAEEMDEIDIFPCRSHSNSVGVMDIAIANTEHDSGFRFSNREYSIPTRSLFVADDDDDEENETSNNSALAIYGQNNEQHYEGVGPAAAVSIRSPATVSTASSVAKLGDTDDEEDDTPRFNFRSRREI
ncbi:Xrs2p [Kluyveromyces lactis]|uniref:KLLA0E02201p n=1 Tax=Kluyveromyces lactis (strain ATCC 8585 / CBS 2359 / DSM 70799 / NBRC 1267 / NRRL Y-1140 / WM37) TaxID=284590 RepID=Q6CPU2_KLULA|nr:uncharacterized protein KLLA0_E02201g [Kluyveromyces lactis]CAG99134.1 KLLA0E02201p [Kluyveromyces lactis]|eukprot:XP_454047.1 uncharacterized protein KLLA0_E02201g [Kluyveromyces lactis]